MKTPILNAERLSYKTADGRWLFRNLHVELRGGECLLITGPNGSGKSTLLSLLLEKLSSKRKQLKARLPYSIFSFIPQLQNMEFHLPLTLRDVIEITREKPVTTFEIEAIGLLKSKTLDLTWSTASGGERQRTLLTTALLENPRLLILDEPFNHLDAESQNFMLGSLDRFLASGSGTDNAIILVSHLDTKELSKWGKRLRTVVLPYHDERPLHA